MCQMSYLKGLADAGIADPYASDSSFMFRLWDHASSMLSLKIWGESCGKTITAVMKRSKS